MSDQAPQAKPLTPAQRDQLKALLAAGAVCRQQGRSVYELRSPKVVVIGKLRNLGLADSVGIKRHGRAWTEYWLTPAGRERAQALASEGG